MTLYWVSIRQKACMPFYIETRTNWPRKVCELILDSDSRSQGVKGHVFRVPGSHGVGFHCPRRLKGRLSGSQGVKG